MANAFTVNSYSPKDVQLIVAGYQITGWESITLTRRTKSFTDVPGIRGKHTRTASQDTSATLSFSLIQTTQSNEVLSVIHEQDIDSKTGRLNITLKDVSGKSIFSSDEGYITAFPTVRYSGQFEYRPWEIFMQRTSGYLVAGNATASTSLFDAALSSTKDFVGGLF